MQHSRKSSAVNNSPYEAKKVKKSVSILDDRSVGSARAAASPNKRKTAMPGKSHTTLLDESSPMAKVTQEDHVSFGGGGRSTKTLRKTVTITSIGKTSIDRQSVANTIARASMKFQMAEGQEQGELVIENERLKTSIMVL